MFNVKSHMMLCLHVNARQTYICHLTFTFPIGHLKLPKPACASAASVVVPRNKFGYIQNQQ